MVTCLLVSKVVLNEKDLDAPGEGQQSTSSTHVGQVNDKGGQVLQGEELTFEKDLKLIRV